MPLGAKKGKAILVSGHDLKDLEELLKQTEGKGINVYTHGEMLPTHGYPGLKKYPTSTATTGRPGKISKGVFGFSRGHSHDHQLHPEAAGGLRRQYLHLRPGRLAGCASYRQPGFLPGHPEGPCASGFSEDSNGKEVMVGFGRNTVLGVADKVIDAVKNKAIRHFFLVAGCDGAKPGRNYYTEFVEKVPKDCVVLTLACGKFRFFDKDLGTIGGLPRLMDMGQCNDAYSAIQVAVALAKAFGVGVNDLPLSLILSWYEQKAVAILLTLLALGIKNIRLGPSLPAFTTANVLDVLVKNYNIKPITTPDADLKDILG